MKSQKLLKMKEFENEKLSRRFLQSFFTFLFAANWLTVILAVCSGLNR